MLSLYQLREKLISKENAESADGRASIPEQDKLNANVVAMLHDDEKNILTDTSPKKCSKGILLQTFRK